MENVRLYFFLIEIQFYGLCFLKESLKEECQEVMEIEISVISIDFFQKFLVFD